MAHISPLWHGLYVSSTVLGIGVGLYGRRRTNFSNDFSYNKLHFGVFLNITSGGALALCAKQPKPIKVGGFFIATLLLNCLPAYYEGIKDIRNKPLDDP